MKIITELKEANNLLKQYEGALVQVYLFSISLRRLMFRLDLAKTKKVLYLVGVGCNFYSGKFYWRNANLFISKEFNEYNETITRIIDKEAGFELVTSSGVTIYHGYDNEFGNSFDGFIKDKKIPDQE